MTNNVIHPVILCGGSGTRLWPRSRKTKPKPFIPLLGDQTLFRQALDRCSDRKGFAAPTVVAGQAHVPLIKEQAQDIAGLSIMAEPCARNTAPAIALAAARLNPDAVMLVCPSDHYIADSAAFSSAAVNAAALARKGWLVSFGIAPDRPETGYGYIRRADALDGGYRVAEFVEKPDLSRAEAFLADGSYSWNGGIFAFRAGTLLDELRAHRPRMAELVELAVAGGRSEGICFHADANRFAEIEGESIDYAVMENTERAAMVPVSMGWSDIGNWAALQDALPSDTDGNHAQGRSELINCQNVLAITDGPRISAVGLSDICIIVDGDEVLVTSREGAQLVGKLGGPSEQ